jgi:class 3 adenylate cyclase
VTEFSLETEMLDLEAVVDRVGLDRFALLGFFWHGPVAINYAVQHPEQVSHLILWLAQARGSDESPRQRAMQELAETDWNLYTSALAGLFGGQPEEVAAVAAFLRECVTPEAAKALHDASLEFDVTDLLPKVTSPTLVCHRRQYQLLDLEVSKSLVAQIPGARLVLLEGDSPFAYIGDLDAVLDAVDEFLSEGAEAEAQAGSDEPSGLVTILFTDMESSTALTQRLGDAGAQELVHTHNSVVRDALKANHGSEIKHTGDGIMASFPSARGALDCAVAIQRGLDESDNPVRVRIGLNAGEPVAEDDDLFGTSVQLAARVCGEADAGEILVSNVVRELAAGKGFLFNDRGDAVLRGFEDPVRLYEVRWRES